VFLLANDASHYRQRPTTNNVTGIKHSFDQNVSLSLDGGAGFDIPFNMNRSRVLNISGFKADIALDEINIIHNQRIILITNSSGHVRIVGKPLAFVDLTNTFA